MGRMCSQILGLAMACLCMPSLASASASISGTRDGSEQWGYIDVRPGAQLLHLVDQIVEKLQHELGIGLS